RTLTFSSVAVALSATVALENVGFLEGWVFEKNVRFFGGFGDGPAGSCGRLRAGAARSGELRHVEVVAPGADLAVGDLEHADDGQRHGGVAHLEVVGALVHD